MSDEDLSLYVEITKPDGRTFRLDGDGYAEDIPEGLGFSTKRMEGCSTFSCTLNRRVDEEYPDIDLRDDLAVFSATGDWAWEGRITAAPRSLDGDTETIDVQATGHIAALKDRKFQQIYVDRDLSHWQPPSTLRKVALNTNFRAADPSVSDKVRTSVTGPWTTTPGRPTSEAWYDSAGIPIGEIQATWTRGAAVSSGGDANWTWVVNLSDDRVGTTTDTTGDLQAAGPATATLAATDDDRLFAVVALSYGNVAAGDQREYAIDWGPIAVYGRSGIPTHDALAAGEPDGVYASEVMADIIANYAPKLRWAGNDSTYPISQMAFRDLTFPYDALLECNRFHILDLACWENKTVYWAPVDLTDWDWEVRRDDPGFRMVLEGDADEGSGFNGIVVQYTDIQTGELKTLWPDDHDELVDASELNPANLHGDKHWDDVTLSIPCFEADALQMGRMKLAEANQPKSPGQYTLGGRVRDRQGNWQPSWKVRATDRIVLVDHPNRRPRLITETAWSQESHSLTLSTDSASLRFDALVDRHATALAAANLT